MNLAREDFGYSYDSYGYMIQYKDRNIGGAGVDRKTAKALRGRAATKQREDYALMAESTIQDLIAGRGHQYFRDNILKLQ